MSTRGDGRGPDQLRSVKITRGYLAYPHGSSLMEMGATKVICAVSFEERVPSFLAGKEQGWLTAEYSMLPGSTQRRTIRDTATGRIKARSQEIQRIIGRSLRSVVDLKRIPEGTLYVDCDVIQADGGTRTAAITGAYVALRDAVNRMREQGLTDDDPLLDAVAAVSVGLVAGVPVLDLCYEEDAQAAVDMNVVMTGSGGLVEVQGTAEEAPFSRDQMDRMLDLAERGIRALLKIQQDVLR